MENFNGVERNSEINIAELEANLLRYLELLAKIKMHQRTENENDSESDELKFRKRNPEFTNSLMLYNKLFRKLDRIGKRR